MPVSQMSGKVGREGVQVVECEVSPEWHELVAAARRHLGLDADVWEGARLTPGLVAGLVEVLFEAQDVASGRVPAFDGLEPFTWQTWRDRLLCIHVQIVRGEFACAWEDTRILWNQAHPIWAYDSTEGLCTAFERALEGHPTPDAN